MSLFEAGFEAKGLTLYRAGRVLFAELDIAIQAATVTAVIGPNGAGKSSLLMAMGGVLAAESGELSLHGRAVKDYARAELAKLIAWQGELPPTEFGLSVKQRLQLAAGNIEEPAEYVQAVTMMELEPLLSRNLGELSSGERQRVEIAAVMVRDCPLWLFDEPTSHLDLQHQVTCLKMFRQQASAGRAIITVLHDIAQASAVADYIIMIDGRGGIECGDTKSMMVPEKLESLFNVKLTTMAVDGYTMHLPDYRGDEALGDE